MRLGRFVDLGLFREILDILSTSGKERQLADFLKERLASPDLDVIEYDAGDGATNLLFDWSRTGRPSFVFCTHLDTVPPYLPPKFSDVAKGDALPDGKKALEDDTLIEGRGSNDAKGQIISLYGACRELKAKGRTDFGLLLLSGEETGSVGAKAYTAAGLGGDFVLVGEPTGNRLVSASKGTKAFRVTLKGRPCHSGYPEQGVSAIDRFVDLANTLKGVDFPADPVLGPTTWNIGELRSDNPQNVLSPQVSFRIYFRTTFTTDALIHDKLLGACGRHAEVEDLGGDEPLEYFHSVEGIPSAPASFGSDAPRLTGFRRKAICGPGSILTAHTDKEYVLVSDLDRAVMQYVKIYEHIQNERT